MGRFDIFVFFSFSFILLSGDLVGENAVVAWTAVYFKSLAN